MATSKKSTAKHNVNTLAGEFNIHPKRVRHILRRAGLNNGVRHSVKEPWTFNGNSVRRARNAINNALKPKTTATKPTTKSNKTTKPKAKSKTTKPKSETTSNSPKPDTSLPTDH